MISGYFLIFRLICLNLNLNLVGNQVQTREELKNYLVIPMLTVSCSRLVELDQAISSIIKNPKSYQTVERWTCIGGKRHICKLCTGSWRILSPLYIYIGFETLGFQAWFGIADFSLFFLAVQLLIFHVFWELKPCLSYICLSPCHRIIFEYEVIIWGWKPVRFTQLSANGLLLCASDIAPYPCNMWNWFQYHWTSIFCAKCLGLFL